MALVLAYAFDTGSGTTATDASGNGNHGTIVNAAWSASGHTSNALSFDGAGDYVSFPTLGIFGAGASWTMMAWVYLNNIDAVNRQVVHPRAEKDVSLAYRNNVRFGAGFNTGAGAQYAISTTVPAATTWYHIAAVWNNGANTIGIAVNGTTEATIALGTPQSLTDTNAVGGIISGSPSQYWDGLIDDVRIFNEALSDASITTYMNTPVEAAAATDFGGPSSPMYRVRLRQY
jgi:hypothetical protein